MDKKIRRHLKKMAQDLNPVVMVGHKGITDSLIHKTDKSLENHELIKIKFLEFKEEKDKLAEMIAGRTHSEVVTIIGHVAVLFRRHPDPEKQNKDLTQL